MRENQATFQVLAIADETDLEEKSERDTQWNESGKSLPSLYLSFDLTLGSSASSLKPKVSAAYILTLIHTLQR